MTTILSGSPLPNIPWEERPANSTDVVWRSGKNPIINRGAVPLANSIFNSAVVSYQGGFVGVFRVDHRTRTPYLHLGKSLDGLHWTIDPNPIVFQSDNEAINTWEYGYDPRLCWLEDRYYVTWCNGYCGEPTIGIAYTFDFKTFHQVENAFLPYNRNGVLFSRRIGGKYCMLSRPSDNGHTPFGNIYLSQSNDLVFWGQHRLVMKANHYGWQSKKIGAGPIPIETSEGWLMIYHGVLISCNGFVYSFGAALLDLEQPWKVLYRTAPYLLAPHELYECVGDTPNVTFPCAALSDPATGRLVIYYGAADTTVCLAYAQVEELVDFIKTNSDV